MMGNTTPDQILTVTILEKLIDYSLSISINDYQFNETLIKIVYLNIDVKETTKEKLNVALSEIIAEIYLIKIKEFELKDEIEKIKRDKIYSYYP
mgnify:CR=1 FL=1